VIIQIWTCGWRAAGCPAGRAAAATAGDLAVCRVRDPHRGLPADADFLFAKNFGHSMARWTAGLFPDDVAALSEAAGTAGVPTRPPPRGAKSRSHGGRVHRTGALAGDRGGPRRTRRGRRNHPADDHAHASRLVRYVFGLRQLLFEARIIDAPAVRRRGGGRATREARLAVVAAPEIRRTLLAYIDARTAVLRPKSIEKLTSALAIFGEFLSTSGSPS
jgi:hypothetical protein